MKKAMMISVLLMAMLNAVPQQALASDSLWDKTKAGASTAWESTTSMVEDAVVWTMERSTAAWEATRKAAGKSTKQPVKKQEKGSAAKKVAANNKHKG